MELCALPAISNTPVCCGTLASKLQLRSNHALLLKKPVASRSSRALDSRFHRLGVSLPRASASDDSNGTGSYITEERDSVVTLEEAPSSEKNFYNEISTSEVSKEEPVESGSEQTFEFLDGLKLESVDAYSIVLYGTGALAGLWLVSAIVGAIDSIPLFPKLMEVVGLGFTLWFSTRFLLFKESRDELAAKIEEVKKQVLGSDEE